MSEYKMIRLSEATWDKLAKIRKQLTHKEGRTVSFDETIASLVPRRKK